MTEADVVIVGAGLAGAATAYHLARAGTGRVLVLEREPVPGAHASGRNAGLLRRLVEDRAVCDLAVAGAAALGAPPADLAPGPLFSRTGSLLLAGPREAPDLAAAAGFAGARAVPPAEVERLAPELLGAPPAAAAWHTAEDGVVDIHALLRAYLEAAAARGAAVMTGCAATGLELDRGGVCGVRTTRGLVTSRAVVDAAGAWAGALARSANGAGVPLVAYRRHLFTSAPARRPRGRPWVWDVAHGLYFRAEGPGYLLSGCDEDAHEPGDPPVDPNRRADLAKRVLRWMPALGELELVRSWACLRTFAPDRRPVIGPDPEIRGLFYAAGLGGHGVTASFAIGRLAAAGVLAPKEVPALFHAERFARPRKA